MPRFLFSSSCSLYGAAGDAPVDETAAFNPVTPYGESKAMAEEGLAEARRRRLQSRPICATPRRTAPRLGCGPTSWSTT